MSGTILVRGARQLLTLHGAVEPRRGFALAELGIIRDGALLIEDGRIIEVGPSRRIENLEQARRAQEIDATGRVVMPGFVDCHTHLIWDAPWLDVLGAQAAQASDAAANSSLNVLRTASSKRLEARARQFVNGMARHGTTSLDASSGYGLDQRAELKLLRVQARLGSAPVDITSTYLSPRIIPAGYGDDPAEYVSRLCAEVLPAIRHRSLARFAGFRCGGPVFEAEHGRRFLESARNLGFKLRIHGGRSTTEEAVQLAVEAGAQSVDQVAGAEETVVELLAKSGTIAILLPGAGFLSGSRGNGSARSLIDAGAAVALATNFNPGTSPTYSMQIIVALACAHLGMSAAEAICAATYNAACVIGSEPVAGSLEVGKRADLIVLNAADYREIPYHFGVNLVYRTLKNGITIYHEGKVALR